MKDNGYACVERAFFKASVKLTSFSSFMRSGYFITEYKLDSHNKPYMRGTCASNISLLLGECTLNFVKSITPSLNIKSIISQSLIKVSCHGFMKQRPFMTGLGAESPQFLLPFVILSLALPEAAVEATGVAGELSHISLPHSILLLPDTGGS